MTDSVPQTSGAMQIPSSLPKVITPQGGIPDAPRNSTLIQIGFTHALNYQFVTSSTKSVAQIFQYLPDGLSFGMSIPGNQVQMQSLQPFAPASLNYIVTLAMAYIPEDMVDQLSVALHAPVSQLFQNPDADIAALMNYIDPTIPLLPGSSVSSGGSGTNSNGGNSGGSSSGGQSWIQNGDNMVDSGQGNSGSSTNEDDGAPFASDGTGRNQITGKTVLIGAGSVGAAALYGVAMFFLARRYRKNRIAHQRASSMGGGGVDPSAAMTQVMAHPSSPSIIGGFFYGSRSPGLPTDKRGSKGSKNSKGSARGQISGPVMSENSLGWN